MSTSAGVPHALGGRAEERGSFDVLVVGSGGVLAEALTRLLIASGVRAAHTDDGGVETALARHRPEVVLLDGGLGSERLVECAELVRGGRETVRLLLLATGEEEDGLAGRLQAAVFSAWSAPSELLRAISGTAGGRAERHNRQERSPHSRISQLTVRELQILRMLMAGASSAKVADTLRISAHTVRTHVQNILGKLNARTRLEAATIGFHGGLRPHDDVRHGEETR